MQWKCFSVECFFLLIHPEQIVENCASLKFVQQDGAHDALNNGVGIAIRARATVLEVAHALVGNAARNANGAAAICSASTEIVDR